jgi:very-short-patch-repair endonuclease
VILSDGCLTRILRLLGLESQSNEVDAQLDNEPLPYRLNGQFVSPAELSFYQVLRSVINEQQAVICPKVGLGDLFFITKQFKSKEYFRYRNYIAQKHVDFVLCEPNSMRPLLAIELDDSSHQHADREQRDSFVDKVFETAGLPLYHIPVRATYNTEQLGAKLREALERSAVSPTSAVAINGEAPLCPKCGIPMLLRTATRGKHTGEQFYGCQNYPNCREMIPITHQPPE